MVSARSARFAGSRGFAFPRGIFVVRAHATAPGYALFSMRRRAAARGGGEARPAIKPGPAMNVRPHLHRPGSLNTGLAPTRASCSKTNVLRSSFPTACGPAPQSASPPLPSPRIFISTCIGGQSLSPTPLPPCLQWVTHFLHSWLRCRSRIPGCPSPCTRQAAAAPVCPGHSAPARRGCATAGENGGWRVEDGRARLRGDS